MATDPPEPEPQPEPDPPAKFDEPAPPDRRMARVLRLPIIRRLHR
jgi:hypothetical protein